ncbi:hypothetical protein PAECIP111893_04139 [Paenibacillus plantiphilus]|uniref:Uncharacterized protein n=1 Tax=Paenibacillus plantiphilus TaxID=2905650 RepID=A0ABN8GV53_9BACL|nr:hypothetical protein [Paenibacillus plantiphilus]CAH1216495.1 hypothetical protein PAECIP111893_04139 [Paenibacillus plantiphilus]
MGSKKLTEKELWLSLFLSLCGLGFGSWSLIKNGLTDMVSIVSFLLWFTLFVFLFNIKRKRINHSKRKNDSTQ